MKPRCFLSRPTKKFSLQNRKKTEWEDEFFLNRQKCPCVHVAFIFFSFPLDSTLPFSFLFSFFLFFWAVASFLSFFSLGSTVALFLFFCFPGLLPFSFFFSYSFCFFWFSVLLPFFFYSFCFFWFSRPGVHLSFFLFLAVTLPLLFLGYYFHF